MKTYEMKKYRKKECTYKTTHISAATYHKLQTVVPNQSLVSAPLI